MSYLVPTEYVQYGLSAEATDDWVTMASAMIEVTYRAGLATVPAAVKVACAQVVRNAQATPALNVKSSRLDTMQMQYFSSSLLDEQVKLLLRPYVAQKVG